MGQAGSTLAAFFSNLSPLFAAVLSVLGAEVCQHRPHDPRPREALWRLMAAGTVANRHTDTDAVLDGVRDLVEISPRLRLSDLRALRQPGHHARPLKDRGGAGAGARRPCILAT